MANSRHVEWLKEGVRAWNKRRERQPFDPNLAGIVSDETLGDLKDARGDITLGGINLEAANLSGADLSRVSLRDSNLREACLTQAKLTGIKLDQANCSLADFSGADLSQATIKDADFSFCELSRANLYEANLTGVDLTASEVWKADIFPKRIRGYQPFNTEKNSEEEISSVSSFLKAFKTIKSVYSGYPRGPLDTEGKPFKIGGPSFYFRGHRRKSWNLCPSVMRDDRLKAAEEDMLLDIMTQQPNAFKGVDSALAEWVLAQHYGLKTRLLDVTRNPLVALFYACGDASRDSHDTEEAQVHVFAVGKALRKTFRSDTISVIANFAKLSQNEKATLLGETELASETSLSYKDILGKLYYYIRREKPYFHEKIDPRDFFKVFIVEPQQSFERIRIQSGAFLISCFHEQFDRQSILQLNTNTPVYNHYMLTIPKDCRKRILDELKLLNVARETLFPGLDEAARAITSRYSL